MDMKGYQQYKQQSINSMTPGELLLLLYDELVKRATIASIALEKKDYDLLESTVQRCIDIIHYLDETLDRQYPISHDLSRLYEYFTFQFRRVMIGRNAEVLNELRPMLSEMRDTFRIAEKNVSQGK